MLSNYKLFLDDIRNPEDVYKYMLNDSNEFVRLDALKYKNNEDWVVVRSYQEYVFYILEHGIPSVISFDHDLADFSGINGEERTGYDCAKWLVSVLMDNPTSFPNWDVHSKNSVGAKNIDNYLKNAIKHLK